MECGVDGQPHKTPHFHHRHRHPSPRMTLPRRAWVRLNRLRTSVGRFRSCLYKWGMASSAACECGAEEQTSDHVVLQCLIHRPLHGLHGLRVLDDVTTEWLLNTCPEIWRGQAVDRRTRSKEEHKIEQIFNILAQILTFLLVIVVLDEIRGFKLIIGCFSTLLAGLDRSRSIAGVTALGVALLLFWGLLCNSIQSNWKITLA